MWISVIGPEGSAKKEIKNHIEEQGYKFRDLRDVYLYSAVGKISSLFDLFDRQLDIQDEMRTKDIVTIGTIWDAHEIYSQISRGIGYWDAKELEMVDDIYKKLCKRLDPPQMFIYCKSDVVHIQSWLEMTARPREQEDIIIKVLAEYDRLIKKIRVPVIEIDVTGQIDEAYNEVNYGMSSIKATADERSMWKKKIF